MARAGYFQAEVAIDNVIALIEGRQPSHVYNPNPFIEGSLKLTLGKVRCVYLSRPQMLIEYPQSKTVIYTMDDQGNEILIPAKGGSEDLDIRRGWSLLGMNIKDAGSPGLPMKKRCKRSDSPV